MSSQSYQEDSLQQVLHESIRHTLRPAAVILGILFAIFAFIHPFFLPQAIALPLTATAALSSVLLFGLFALMMYVTIPGQHLQYISRGVIILITADLLLQLIVSPDPGQTTYFLLLVIGAGMLLVSLRWLILVVGIALTGWGAIVWIHGFTAEWLPYSLGLLTAAVLGVLVLQVRIRNIRHLVENRSTLEEQLRKREEDLAESQEALEKEVAQRQAVEETHQIQNDRFRKIFENADEGILYLRKSGEIIEANQKLEEVSGYSRKELVGTNFFSHAMFPAETSEKVERFFRRVMHQNGNADDNAFVDHLKGIELVQKNGNQILVEASAAVMQQNGDSVEGILATLRDVTDREDVELRLALHTVALEATSSGIMITDVEGRILWVNPALTELTNYTAEELIGNTPRMFKSGKHANAFYREMWDTILSGETWERELINRRKDGTLYPEEQCITPVRGADGTITHFISIKEDITERIEAEDALHSSEHDFRDIFEQMHDGVFRATADGEIVLVNSAFIEMLSYPSVNDVIGANLLEDSFFTGESLKALKEKLANHEALQNFQATMRTRKEKEILVRLNIHKRQDNNGGLRYYEGTIEDITEQNALKQQLIQAQKMEAIGQLAGGVAHDFNNLLTVIKGYSQLLLAEISFDQDHEYYNNLMQIDSAAKRAESLTRQLLAFSRRQILEPKILDLNDIIQNLEKMLRRLIEEDIELTIKFGSELGGIKADSGQVEQVIINMVVNARDAMPEGGKLVVETGNTVVSKNSDGVKRGVKPGAYVRLSITDNGIGMDEEVQSKIFDPFFTTKEKGKGTGLGLATVYGIIQQNGGYILVDSTPGIGTTFDIYLPLVSEEATDDIAQSRKEQKLEGTETILVVEDESELRKVIVETLEMYGYTVLEAIHSANGLSISREYDGQIDLLLTDVVMPEINGKELATRITSERPDITVLYMSGYTDDVIAQYDIIKKGVRFLQKPFTPMDLGYKIRSVLEE